MKILVSQGIFCRTAGLYKFSKEYSPHEKYKQFGFSCNISSDTSFITVHWFQFADYAAVISGQEQENQILLNRFSIWCKWAGMKIRVDKCVTVGTKKS